MNYLERLGIHPKVQSFFKTHLTISCDTLVFNYGDASEHAGAEFHKIPITESHWLAGEPGLASALFICASAMDAISWLNQNHIRFSSLSSLCFLAIGSLPYKSHAETIQKITPKKKLHFIFSNDPLGTICDLKLASFIRNKPLKISFSENLYQVEFEHKHYTIAQLSLNALEKSSGYYFKIRSHKPKNASTYYEQLRNRHPT